MLPSELWSENLVSVRDPPFWWPDFCFVFSKPSRASVGYISSLLLCCLWFKIHYHYLLLNIFSWRQPQYLLEIMHNFGLSLNPFQLCQLGFYQDAYGVLKIEWECNSLVKLFRFSFSLLEKVILFKRLIHFICYPVYFHKGVHNILFPFGLWRICSGIFFSISDNVHMCFFFSSFFLDQSC